MLHLKDQLDECYRLRGLKQARKLLEKATALSDQNRLLIAIASGKASRFDRLISLGLRQKKRGPVGCWFHVWQRQMDITAQRVLWRRKI